MACEILMAVRILTSTAARAKQNQIQLSLMNLRLFAAWENLAERLRVYTQLVGKHSKPLEQLYH